MTHFWYFEWQLTMLSISSPTMLSVLPSDLVTPCNRPESILTNSVQGLLLNSRDLTEAQSSAAQLTLLKEALYMLE